MCALLDSPELNQRLFYRLTNQSPTPASATDLGVQALGATLQLRWHRSSPPRVVLLLFHGNGEVVADYDAAAPAFAAAGVDLAVVDYRGYGGSTGEPTLRSAIEDAPRVLAELGRQGPPGIFVMGRSVGSACAAEIYGRAAPPLLRGVILESGFCNLFALVRRRGLEPPSGFSPEELEVFDPLPKLRRGGLPLLVLHGEEDDLISPSEARACFSAAGTPVKELCLIPGRGHNDLSSAPQYWSALRGFVGRLP